MGFTWDHVLYRFYGSDGHLLYVGITNSISTRFSAHSKSQPWWGEVTDCRVEFFPDRPALARAEMAAVRYEQPRYNLRGAPADRVPDVVAVRKRAAREMVRLSVSTRRARSGKRPMRSRMSDDEWAWMHSVAPEAVG